MKEKNWKQILEFIRGMKGIYARRKERLRVFMEAVN